MGAKVSQFDCVDMKDLPADVYEAIVSQTYTVQRNPKNDTDPIPGVKGAREDEGWKISRESVQGISWASAHATFRRHTDDKMIWQFHMVNGFEPTQPGFLYGWRILGSFWPTHLTTWEEREAWFDWLRVQVETLKTPQQKMDLEEGNIQNT
jgi:hypothetical protein